MMRFLARHRRIINVIVIIAFIAGFVYFTIKTRDIKIGTYDSKTYSGIAFNTAIKKTIFMNDVDRRDQIDAEIDKTLREIDEKLSYRNEDSEVAFFNRNYATGGIYNFDPEIISYLKKEMEICKETDGAFCPCILPLTRLWGIEDGNNKVPSDKDIKDRLARIDYKEMEVTDEGLTLNAGNMAIDFGASGKGIAADKVYKVLSDNDVPGAIISIGGTILTYGSKGADDIWRVGIQDPRGATGDAIGAIEVGGGTFISTSGDYEKFFEVDGKRYHHILDPKTGYPADNGLISVTIATDNGLTSDAMSTACFVMGLEDGMRYAESKGADAVFVTSDKKIHLSKGLKKRFIIKAKDYEIAK